MVVDSRVQIPDDLDEVGLGAVAGAYAFIVIVAIGAAIRFRCWHQSHTDLFLAGHSVGFVLVVFTLIATWIGGAIVHLTAGRVYNGEDGFLWAHAPIALAFSLLLGGLIFASKVNELGYMTILDPIERRFGRVVVILIAVPLIAAQVLWAAASFSSLSVLLAVALGVESVTPLVISIFVVYVYSSVGGQYSVIFTDTVQILFIFFGLWLAFGFAHNNEAVRPLSETAHDWLGVDNVPRDSSIGRYIDSTLRFLFAGTVFQIYIQRVLSGRSVKMIQVVSLVAAIGTLFFVIPGILIGAVARSTDFSKTIYNGTVPSDVSDFRFVLPLVVKVLTPRAVSVLVLALLAAACLSSSDASIVSSAVLFTNNVYSTFRFAKSKEYPQSRELLVITRIAMAVVVLLALLLALFVRDIFDFWSFATSLVYVLVFPQILVALYVKFSNGFGSLCAYVVGIVIFFLSGDEGIGLPAVIKYPFYDEERNRQNFPWKTILVLLSLLILIVVSALTGLWVKQGCLHECYDALGSSHIEEKQKKSRQYLPAI